MLRRTRGKRAMPKLVKRRRRGGKTTREKSWLLSTLIHFIKKRKMMRDSAISTSLRDPIQLEISVILPK